jgi:hypothetical protein
VSLAILFIVLALLLTLVGIVVADGVQGAMV